MGICRSGPSCGWEHLLSPRVSWARSSLAVEWTIFPNGEINRKSVFLPVRVSTSDYRSSGVYWGISPPVKRSQETDTVMVRHLHYSLRCLRKARKQAPVFGGMDTNHGPGDAIWKEPARLNAVDLSFFPLEECDRNSTSEICRISVKTIVVFKRSAKGAQNHA